ncbi:hypothetical protein KEM60_02018 [Austwickia sp. TVS 96-490-7B]|uniref:hypothetical protein n=1 Tax=Austwickia sp. TVS 96-490-7B TaxID=2830843 RepID=UPI001C57AA14|nr:hypothetical protein [Austwickia sp. TVS 96-490-7B]MBW3085807.1 hypothetical protein [Austwickia sp. TVS 96-490-7B]
MARRGTMERARRWWPDGGWPVARARLVVGARRVGSALVGLALVAVMIGSGWSSLRIAQAGFGPHDVQSLLTDQLHRLEPYTNSAAPEVVTSPDPRSALLEMALTGLATSGDDSRPAAVRLPLVRAYLQRFDEPDLRTKIGGAITPNGGVFLQAWGLLLADEVARLSGSQEDRDAVRRRALPLLAELRAAPGGVLRSGPGLIFPADTVVLAGALHRADVVAGVPDAGTVIAEWVRRIEPLRDPGTRLLPHRLSEDGKVVDGPRASSSAVTQIFWPSIDQATSSRDWVAFENTFLCPRLGLVAVCEYPGGEDGMGEHGPLVAGVSPAATLLTFVAARTHGSAELADQISREATLVLGPVLGEDGDSLSRQQALHEAMLAWGRALPVGAELPGVDDRDAVPWLAWCLGALIPGVLALGALTWRFVGRRRRVSGPLELDAVPPDSPSPWDFGGHGRENHTFDDSSSPHARRLEGPTQGILRPGS